jgi:hypothetical protein
MEAAIADAEKKAKEWCPEGCKCEGVAIPDGPPTCRTGGSADDPYCVCSVGAILNGTCSKPGGKKAPAAPGASIKAGSLREFFKKVAELPTLPRNPKGKCRMYKEQRGHGFYYPVCAGDCTTGKCRTIVEVGKRSVSARCECS